MSKKTRKAVATQLAASAVEGSRDSDAAGSAPADVLPRLGQVLGLVCLFILPLASGGFSGWGYQFGFVLLPLAAALCLPSLRLNRWAAGAIAVFILSPPILLNPLLHPVHAGYLLWYDMLALLSAWIIARSILRDNAEMTRWLIPAAALSAVLTALVGLFPFWGHWLNHGDLNYEVVSTFGLHNAYAGFLLLAWPVALLAASQTPRRALRAFWYIAAVLLATTLLLTHSRAAAFILVLQLLIWALLTLRARLRLSAWVTTVAAIILFGLPCAALGWYYGQHYDYSMAGRIAFWHGALRIFAAHPLTGIGLGGFRYVFPQYQRDWMYYSVDPHSWFLQLLCELGLLGGVITILILLGFVHWSRVSIGGAGVSPANVTAGTAAPPISPATATLCCIAVAGSLTHAAFDFDYTFAATTSLLGVLLAVGSFSHDARFSATSTDPAQASGSYSVIWPYAILFAVYAVLGQFLTLERFTLDALRAAPNRAPELLRQAVGFVSINEETQLDLAEALARQQGRNSPDARAHAERATQLAPDYAAAWALRGALEERPELRDINLERAIALDPYNHPEFYFAWAQAAQNGKDRYARLKLGVQRIPAEHPITPDHVRAPDWYRFNPLWAQWWNLLAKLETDPAVKKKYREFASEFGKYVTDHAADFGLLQQPAAASPR